VDSKNLPRIEKRISEDLKTGKRGGVAGEIAMLR